MRTLRIFLCLLACLVLTACDTFRSEPMPEEYRHLMRRVVLFQGDVSTVGSGNILDLGPTTVTVTPGPGQTEERTDLASGGQLAIRRMHRVEIPISKTQEAEFGRFMAQIDGCGDAQLLMMGGEQAESWAWFEPTAITVSQPPADAGGLGRVVLTMQTRVFDAAIGQGDLLSMTAWEGATRDSGTGNLTHASREDYQGPAWTTSAGAPEFDGSYDAGTATVTVPAPIEGAELSLYAENGSLSGEITFLDWFGDTISTDVAPESATVPAYTWALEVDVTQADSRPRLDVLAPGSALGVRRGDTVTGCDDRAVAPYWLDVIREDGPILADITSLTGTGDPLTNVEIVVEGNVSFTRAVFDSGSGPFLDDDFPILEATDTFTYVYDTGSKTVTANSVVYDSNADETTIGIDESINLSESTPVRVEIPFTLPPPLGS